MVYEGPRQVNVKDVPDARIERPTDRSPKGIPCNSGPVGAALQPRQVFGPAIVCDTGPLVAAAIKDDARRAGAHERWLWRQLVVDRPSRGGL